MGKKVNYKLPEYGFRWLQEMLIITFINTLHFDSIKTTLHKTSNGSAYLYKCLSPGFDCVSGGVHVANNFDDPCERVLRG